MLGCTCCSGPPKKQPEISVARPAKSLGVSNLPEAVKPEELAPNVDASPPHFESLEVESPDQRTLEAAVESPYFAVEQKAMEGLQPEEEEEGDMDLVSFTRKLSAQAPRTKSLKRDKAKEVVKAAWKCYVREMEAGITLPVISGGQVTNSLVQLVGNKKQLKVDGTSFDLTTISQTVKAGAEIVTTFSPSIGLSDLEAECACALSFSNGTAVGFMFKDPETTHRFASCLKINRHLLQGGGEE
uniref:Uncharacterized protein n=1 Tax=Chromera velia CCMP2878 TaxID=1169474 RepID=A0A0G4FHU8_9ALVE|mmetsp:Transcript_52936/g.103529  ORF Transcript_52936/g.103529 Transcript_52936/m.103529 type:complete len:242 (+) Transcript_52936:222-947(+)|eukprot:Cvel_16935.t1-p1 / transcript=Cvel_16935.t1 / gene=Cvel_16935 / organism=Chromera_velia_CCMP2878 / gene_product=hypothetical protein / transcript_product=hypothetical protein / location=Cvel_scaffold1328:1472-2194(-) / protein_length=241 / sequence_SO=supercontig / SO=protein_coding / is_pseudo=false